MDVQQAYALFNSSAFNHADWRLPDFDDLYGNYYYGEYNNLPVVPTAAKIVLTVIFVLIFLVCGFGNSLLCFTIFRLKRLRTVTNLFIASLAVSDALVAIICAPLTLYYYLEQNWIFGSILCTIVGTVKVVSLNVSVNTLLVIAMERYYVIYHPLTPRLQKCAVVIIIVSIWVVSLLVSLPTPLYTVVSSGFDINGNLLQYCGEFWEHLHSAQAYIVFLCVFEYLIPMTIMTMAYVSIVRKVWFRHAPGESVALRTRQQQRDFRFNNNKKKTIRMLITVVISFGICWGPYHAYNVTINFYQDVLFFKKNNMTLFYIVEVIAMSNCILNTIVYFLMNETYRKETMILIAYIPGFKRFVNGANIMTMNTAQSTFTIRPRM
ncbi:prokineticin receptor 2-like [Saccoglossus kowalevskii]|uniref:Prokineticin receptor 2-like n=1 Tax=Saccoglossus kowalevskii TaxID=10224 RepID=A0ABM0MI67_SACKO|nr:PREDICTED: prokineticin receptor 2-like [Saccoglossus kowalevskii]